jgi:heme exporter protein A
VLRVEGLGKRFGDRWLFRNLTFDVSTGQCLVVLGPNGSGKSTLLRLLSGLLPPTEGKVHMEGDPRVALGVSSIEMALYPELTVAEHLDFVANVRGCESRTDELIERIGLGAARSLVASKLSTGMKARVKLAISVQSNPRLLILDEPGASLDEKGRELVAGIAKEQMGRGALIIATNDPTERSFATHELILAA